MQILVKGCLGQSTPSLQGASVTHREKHFTHPGPGTVPISLGLLDLPQVLNELRSLWVTDAPCKV